MNQNLDLVAARNAYITELNRTMEDNINEQTTQRHILDIKESVIIAGELITHSEITDEVELWLDNLYGDLEELSQLVSRINNGSRHRDNNRRSRRDRTNPCFNQQRTKPQGSYSETHHEHQSRPTYTRADLLIGYGGATVPRDRYDADIILELLYNKCDNAIIGTYDDEECLKLQDRKTLEEKGTFNRYRLPNGLYVMGYRAKSASVKIYSPVWITTQGQLRISTKELPDFE